MMIFIMLIICTGLFSALLATPLVILFMKALDRKEQHQRQEQQPKEQPSRVHDTASHRRRIR
jgi:hypothetical protein